MTSGWAFVLGWVVAGVWLLALGLCQSSRDADAQMRRFMGGSGS